MTDLEALEVLQARARRLARPLHIAAGLATLATGLALWGILIVVQWGVAGGAEVKLTALGSIAVAAAVVPYGFNRLIKSRLGKRRLEWIDELARTERVSRDVLLDSFTLDSW